MRRRADTSPTIEIPRHLRTRVVPLPSVYTHVSTYRSTGFELQLHSPSLKLPGDNGGGPLAVYTENDPVGGRVTLDPQCFQTGRLTITVEGSFTCRDKLRVPFPSRGSAPQPAQQRKHVFLSLSTVIAVSNPESSPSRSVFQNAFGNVRRRTSVTNFNAATTSSERIHAFSFQLPRGSQPWEELPATFTVDPSSNQPFEVAYKVKVEWEPQGVDLAENEDTPCHCLEVPFLLQPDTDFQSADASSKPESWLEMPLRSSRPLPIRCAITLPTSLTFSRNSSIPYFVVFTTTPRSPELAKEIAADATVSVTLVREALLSEQPGLPLTPPLTPTSEESDMGFRPRLLRRVGRSNSRMTRPRGQSDASITQTRNKPLPQLPPLTRLSQTDTLHSNMSIGFPKRPRQMCDGQKHPSLEAMAAMPDGLYKSKIPLNGDIIPCLDWAGVSVKYYLEVSVILGPDDFRSRIPIRIV